MGRGDIRGERRRDWRDRGANCMLRGDEDAERSPCYWVWCVVVAIFRGRWANIRQLYLFVRVTLLGSVRICR
jgi:hypothetical protein